ncbi:5-carboxymethyl-2-hydroxymuconate Delta-isomerase [Alicyclobacillus sp. SO9]|uniref:5-carboxymethyl-2-hydroxymuconate Delta-isomerase n=1 Tax=Alicyclobacillus sp. SO9 TaxID=2665646 RepID=UPI0018E820CD|nr:5-carboxymethyl-2-hydroxymuconate Delta-isomerase [Alicyclobacillus sp. SO9]QQE79793.1 5-carboxymethyl-2-hydroxymuconate Delta-isomerase [Alicyclobacillus sp. SO9]
MPHVIVEYTDNLSDALQIKSLLKKINEVLISYNPILPTGGIRSRAIQLHDYEIADGKEDDAFIHATLKLGGGRDKESLDTICQALFDVITSHTANLFDTRYLAVSLELYEFSHPTYKKNNIHQRFRS